MVHSRQDFAPLERKQQLKVSIWYINIYNVPPLGLNITEATSQVFALGCKAQDLVGQGIEGPHISVVT